MTTGILNVRVLRHGQASAHADNYDQLSSLGFEQAQRVGEWLIAHDIEFDAIYVGAMQRHSQTLAEIQKAYQAAGKNLPIAYTLPQLNEYDFRTVLRAYATSHADDPHIKAGRWLMVLRAAVIAWARGLVSAPGLESWAEFQIRVGEGLRQIARTKTRENAKTEVLVVSSGGVMGLMTQRALGLEDQSVADINMALKNTSFCDFRVSARAWTLQCLNALPHLAAPDDLRLHTFV